MRPVAVLAIVAATSIASADRLISIPTARKLPYGYFRYEGMFEQSSGRTALNYLNVGIGKSFETEFRTEDFPDRSIRATADLAYNFIAAVPGLTPGIAFGIQDLAGTTADGRRPYVCVTFREPVTTANGDVPADITLGGFLAGQHFGFVGVSLPFSREVRLLVEHNGFRLSSGFEYRPVPTLGFRAIARDRDVLISASITARF